MCEFKMFMFLNQQVGEIESDWMREFFGVSLDPSQVSTIEWILK